MATKAILFTNIEVVSIGDAVTQSRALLLSDEPHGGGAMIRGFLYNSVTPTFELHGLGSLEYTDEPFYPNETWNGANRLLTLQGADGKPRQIRMLLSGRDEPLHVTTFEYPVDYQEIWAVLNHQIVSYWTAPYFLESQQVTIHRARVNANLDLSLKSTKR